jgi:hypothetical protein
MLSDRSLVSYLSYNDNQTLFEVDFTTYSTGFQSVPATYAYTSASNNRFVQTGLGTIASGGNANLLPIGKLIDNCSVGLSLFGSITNGGSNGHVYTTNGTASYSGPFESPDGATQAVKIEGTSTQYGLTFSIGSLVTDRFILSTCWQKAFDANGVCNLRCGKTSANFGAVFNYAYDYRTMVSNPARISLSTNWRRYYFSNPIGGNDSFSIVHDGRATPYTASAYSVYSDFRHILSNTHGVPPEFHSGTLSGSLLTITHDKFLSNGNINLVIDWYPKCKTSNYATNIYLWSIDANNYCYYNGATGKFTVAINGYQTNMSGFFAWEEPEFDNTNVQVGVRKVRFCFILNKLLKTATVYTMIDDVVQSSHNAYIPNPTITYTGNVGICCNKDSSTDGQIHGHILTIKTYVKPDIHSWIRYQTFTRSVNSVRDITSNKLYEVDFSALNAGFNVAPTGLIYECASNNRTIQIDENTVIANGEANLLPIGKLLNTQPLGLAMDGSATNLLSNSVPGDSGWTKVGYTANNWQNELSSFYGNKTGVLSDYNTSTNVYASYPLASPSNIYFSAFVKNIARIGDSFIYHQGLGANTDAAFVRASYATNWVRITNIYTGANKPTISALGHVASSQTAGGISQFACCSVYAGKIGSEYYPGTRAPAKMFIPTDRVASVIDNGRMNFEIEFYPRNSSGDYPSTGWVLWYQPNTRYMSFNSGAIDSKISIIFPGLNVKTTAMPWTVSNTADVYPTGNISTLQTQTRVRLFISIGGGVLNTIVKSKIDNNATQTIYNASVVGNFLTNAPLYIGSYTANNAVLASHIIKIAFYKTGFEPDWTST